MNAFAKVDKQTFLRFAAEHADQRFEFVRGRIVEQMNRGTKKHGTIATRFVASMMEQLSDDTWSIIVDRGVDTPETIRYPVVVVEPADEPDDSLATSKPVVVVEVLSPSTTDEDLDVKPDEYLQLASLDAYIVASQDEPACMVWVRGADGVFANPSEVRGLDSTIVVRGRGFALALPLAKIYRGFA